MCRLGSKFACLTALKPAGLCNREQVTLCFLLQIGNTMQSASAGHIMAELGDAHATELLDWM